MAAAWTINSIDIFVRDYRRTGQEFIATNVPIGSSVPNTQWSGAIYGGNVQACIHDSDYNSFMSISGSSTVPLTGPGEATLSVNVANKDSIRLQSGILDGVTGIIRLVSFSFIQVA